MDQRKTRSKLGKIPFSWENKPGVAKNFQEYNPIEGHLLTKLPPPPCPKKVTCKRNSTNEIQIPLPPCPFQPPPNLKNSSAKRSSYKNQDDPFLAAYKECTNFKSGSYKGTNDKLSKLGVAALLKKSLLNFSCRKSFSVVEGNLVRVSQLPYETK